MRTDRIRAAALLWGGWVIVTGVVFSYMDGIIHPYYMVALAPGIGALVGIGAMTLWKAGPGWAGRAVTAAAVLVTAVWSYVLLDRTPDWLPWLRWVVLVAGLLGAAALLAGPWLSRVLSFRRLVLLSVGFALVAGLAGPAAYALDTVSTAHTGSIPSAGPASAGFGGGGGAPGGFGGGRPGGITGTGATGTRPGGTTGTGFPGGKTASTGGTPPSGTGGIQAGGPGGSGRTKTGSAGTAAGRPAGTGGAAGAGRGAAAGGAGGAGGLAGNTQVSSALEKLLEKNASAYKWVAATEGSEGAAPLELATGDAVMAIGGFNGTDPWPTLAVFEELVAKHEIHYYVGQGSESFGGGQGSSSIASWVAAHFKKETVGGETVYDLTQPLSKA